MISSHPSRPLEDLRRLGQFLVDQASPEEAQLAARRALATQGPMARRRRWVVALTAGALLSSSTVALGIEADDAAPGDVLYPFDRAIETVVSIFGSGNQAIERIDEAEFLLARGDLPLALLTLGEAVEEYDHTTAQELVAASGELSASETTAAVGGLVADLVADARQIATTAQSGDHAALKAAIAAMHHRTSDLTMVADAPGVTQDTPPGQNHGNATDNPSVTAPGQSGGNNGAVDNPSVTAPGQNSGNGNGNGNGQNSASDNPSVTAPGQNKDNGNGNGQGNGQP